MMENLKITKLDAVRRQLETAIRLYFDSADPVSIHTLAAAAYNAFRDFNKKSGGKPLMTKEVTIDCLKDASKKELRDKINAAENFFKHADKDHGEILEFSPRQSEFLIFDVCVWWCSYSGEDPVLFRLFKAWFMRQNPYIFEGSGIETVNDLLDTKTMGRKEFYDSAMPLLVSPPGERWVLIRQPML